MEAVTYWDSSAVVAALSEEARSEEARSLLVGEGIHLISTLTFAEALSVLHRMKAAGHIDDATLDNALELIPYLPWRRLRVSPSWEDIAAASSTYGLRGADLWHLSLVLTLRKRQFPSIRLLTYDTRLVEAAAEEGLTQ